MAVGEATENKLCVGRKEGRVARHILTSSCCRLKPSVINAILKEPEASFLLRFHPSSALIVSHQRLICSDSCLLYFLLFIPTFVLTHSSCYLFSLSGVVKTTLTQSGGHCAASRQQIPSVMPICESIISYAACVTVLKPVCMHIKRPRLPEALEAAAVGHHCEGSFNSWRCKRDKHQGLGELKDQGRREKPGSTEETGVAI